MQQKKSDDQVAVILPTRMRRTWDIAITDAYLTSGARGKGRDAVCAPDHYVEMPATRLGNVGLRRRSLSPQNGTDEARCRAAGACFVTRDWVWRSSTNRHPKAEKCGPA